MRAQVMLEQSDLQRLSRYQELKEQIATLIAFADGPDDRQTLRELDLARQDVAFTLVEGIIRALNIEPPVIDDTAPAQVDVLDQALDIIRAAQRDLGEDLGGSVVDLLLDNLPIDRAAALELIRRIQARGDVRLHLVDTEWNDLYKTGQPVALMNDDGTLTYTRTSSLAWETENGARVVYVEGSVRAHLLSRIQPVEAVPV